VFDTMRGRERDTKRGGRERVCVIRRWGEGGKGGRQR
jgi:hypothetical protein